MSLRLGEYRVQFKGGRDRTANGGRPGTGYTVRVDPLFVSSNGLSQGAPVVQFLDEDRNLVTVPAARADEYAKRTDAAVAS